MTVGHWPFSDQLQHMADQNPFGWLYLLYIFNGVIVNNIRHIFKKADQFLIHISTTKTVIKLSSCVCVCVCIVCVYVCVLCECFVCVSVMCVCMYVYACMYVYV